ncbi:MAG TPA: xanthine dehydrogenase family protein subunit M [Streptosporangiaceae bacterium]|nr:xanthine dehydrogenase family protein subunit M [Streptosporangiaceae bacterium]
MKPSSFGYSRPESVAEAIATLASIGPEGKVLAGGQSLVPLLNLRLAAPSHLVDINRLSELAFISVSDGQVTVGALARHAEVLRDPVAAAAQPLLGQALKLVAHPVIRNRGTTVGSIVHADPAGEMTAVLALLGGSLRLVSTSGERFVHAEDFFLGPLESDVRPGELAAEARFPALAARAGCAFAEVSRRSGDYAVCGVAALVELDAGGMIGSAKAAYLSVGGTPVVLDLTPGCAGRGADCFAEAGRFAMSLLKPGDDIHATAAYRRHLAGVLTERALDEAFAHARGRAGGEEK